MTVLAAARSGVGLLTAAVPESLVASFATTVPEAMWVGCPETRDGGIALESFYLLRPYLEKADAVAMGPGVGTEAETQTLLEEVARNAAGALAVDAEALQERIVAALGKRGAGKGRAILTPHLGEYARISGLDFWKSGEEGLREFCRKSGATMLLKGPPFTRICDGERISYCLPGGPVLARGGSGDILCGMLGSLLAQNPENPAEAARMAAIWHGMAAEMLARECGQQAVRTTQILDYLGAVLRR